jgi:hypothetical protein
VAGFAPELYYRNMTLLFENAIVIAVMGGVFATLALVVFLARRTLGSLIALAAVVGMSLLLLAVERWVVTDREAVQGRTREALAAVESNNVERVLAFIDPGAAAVRADVQALMPLVKVNKARAMGDIEVEVNEAASPPTARATFRGFLDGVHSSSGMHVGYFNQRIDLEWVKRGKRWVIAGYTAYYDEQPIDAVGSARSNRPVGGR